MADVALQTSQLTKQFDSQTAVDGVDLAIAPGEVYGLIGPNGAGKTTLIRMLAAAEEPTTGDIRIQGELLRRNHANAQLKRHLGYLPDDFPLYDDLSVWDYLDYFGRLYFLQEPHRSDRIRTVLDLVHLDEKRSAIISTLSRGMKQRLSLARTILHEPSILLLDEPVSGLDPMARIQFRDALRTLQQHGMTILISSHILSDLEEMCSSVGIMERGRLVESSRLHDLYQRSEVQHILIASLKGLEELRETLPHHPKVQAVLPLPDGHTLRIEFTGNDEDAAALLRSLIQANFPITNFQRSPENLESIFLKLGYQQTA